MISKDAVITACNSKPQPCDPLSHGHLECQEGGATISLQDSFIFAETQYAVGFVEQKAIVLAGIRLC